MNAGRKLANPPPGEEVVITGVSGIFPESENVHAFKENLFNKVDMVTKEDKRWNLENLVDMPSRMGKIPNISKFDAGHFGIHEREARIMDPMIRMLLERVEEAVLDAGIHPSELAGTRTGVFISTVNSDCQRLLFGDDLGPQNFALTGIARMAIANRISHHFKLQGPSYSLDTACSSAMFTLEHAYKAIRNGEVDAAIVGSAMMVLHPSTTVMLYRLGVLSADGKCKAFDDSADGYVRAETVSAILLQKAKDSRRIYAKVVHAFVNCDGHKEQGITHPSREEQKQMLEEFYGQCNVDPSLVDYVEAHGSGTKAGDVEELIPIEDVFCKNRKHPLLLGSVKSNMGHSEPAAALCQIAKAVIIMETGFIPPNLHYSKPKKGIEGLECGRIKIVTDTTPFKAKRGLISINSFGFGGANGHCVLQWNTKTKKDNKHLLGNTPRLVCVSGRTQESVTTIINHLRDEPLDAEFVALLQSAFRYNTPTHSHRGYTIVSKQGEVFRSYNNSSNKQQLPVLSIVFGTEFLTNVINKDLLELPVFYDTINKANKVLTAKGIDIITNKTNGEEEDILREIVVGVAVQIGLFEVLKALLEIDTCCYSTFGYCHGKFANAHAQGIFTVEEAVLAAYYAGKYEYVTPEYLAGKLSNRVADKRRSRIIPPNSVLIEIGTSNLGNLGRSTLNLLPQDGILPLLKIIGSLYEMGFNLNLQTLYPKIEYPVSRGTEMISPLIKWEHKKDWFVVSYKDDEQLKSYQRTVIVDVKDNDWNYVTGHVIDGRNLFPGSGYVYLVLETFAIINGKNVLDMNVAIENIHFTRATTLNKDAKLEFAISIQKSNGHFEVLENDTVVACGKISTLEKLLLPNEQVSLNTEQDLAMEEKDVYKELKLRGYNYSDLFRGINKYNYEQSTALIEWKENWVAFIENMLQSQFLNAKDRNVYVYTHIQSMIINGPRHIEFCKELNNVVPVQVLPIINTIRAGGVEIKGLNASAIKRRQKIKEPLLERYVFIPNETNLLTEQSLIVNMQIAIENSCTLKVKVVELLDDNSSKSLAPLISDVLNNQRFINPEVLVLSNKKRSDIKDESKAFMVVVNNGLNKYKVLKDACNILIENGYVLSREPLDFSAEIPAWLDVLTIHTTPLEKWILMKKYKPFISPTIINISDDSFANFNWLSSLKNAVKNDNIKHVVVFAQKSPVSGILGLVQCIRKEAEGEKVTCMFLQDDVEDITICEEQLKKGFALNVYKDGQWGTYRHLPLENNVELDRKSCFLSATTKGNLPSLKWTQGPGNYSSTELINVHYAALNLKDINAIAGKFKLSNNEYPLGCEFSGKDNTGRSVMGICSGGALANILEPEKHILLPVPEKWSLEDAATVPLAYATVLYALVTKSNIQRGQNVLIREATDDIGQAAVNVALYYNCTVFATVDSQMKRNFIKNNFPGVYLCSNVGNCTDTSFQQLILKKTNGKGVDIILSSCNENKSLLGCLAKGGTYLKIDSNDMEIKHLDIFKTNCSFHFIQSDIFLKYDTKTQLICELLKNNTTNGCIKPLIRTCFDGKDVESAFRFMTNNDGTRIGKVLINIKSEEFEKPLPRYYCCPRGSYVIVGGLGGFGFELANWLVQRGARKLVLASRNGLKNGYQAYKIWQWRCKGVTVKIVTSPVATRDGCAALLAQANNLGPVKAIFNTAVVLYDGMFENQTEKTFVGSFEPKATTTKFLDELSREMCPNLSDFVVFSSITCGQGGPGQTNYGMANSVMERICENRKKNGFPAIAIEWGAISDVGLLQEAQIDDAVDVGGTKQQPIRNCLEVLDQLIRQQDAIVSSAILSDKIRVSNGTENMVDCVAKIIGIRDMKTISLHSTLSELGMDSMMCSEIKQTLEREFNISLAPKEVRSLTFTKLYDMMSRSGEFEPTYCIQNEINTSKKESKDLLEGIKTQDVVKVPVFSY